MDIIIAVIGYLTGILAVLSFIPQTIKTLKTKKTSHLSLKTYIIYNIGNLMFLIIGILSIALPIMWPPGATSSSIIIWGLTIILPYTVTISAVNCIIYVKWKNRKSDKEENIKEAELLKMEAEK